MGSFLDLPSYSTPVPRPLSVMNRVKAKAVRCDSRRSGDKC